MAESSALEALTAELLGDVGKVHDSIKSLPAEISERVLAAVETVNPILARTVGEIEAAVASSARGAETLSKEQLNARIKSHAEELVETFKQQLVPINDMAPTIDKMHTQVRAMAMLAAERKPSMWPAILTGLYCTIFAFIACTGTTLWLNKSYFQAGATLAAKENTGYQAAIQTLPKHLRDKAEAAYQQAYNAN